MIGLWRRSAQPAETSSPRAENVAFANALLETEISERNSRKEAQENTARGLIATAGVLLTLLIGLANDTGVFRSGTTIVAKAAMLTTIVLGAAAAGCSMAAVWPRSYDRLGHAGLDKLNDRSFLDQPADKVAGSVVATRIGIAKTMDTRHGEKAKWVTRSLKLLAAAFVTLVVLAGILVIDPPPPQTTTVSTPIRHSRSHVR